jgi:hypothetical protein
VSKLSIRNQNYAIDTRDRNWYDSLTDEETVKYNKTLWTQQRWISSCTGKYKEHYLEWTNEIVNVHFNIMRHHPKLQFQLLQALSMGENETHEWISPGKKGTDTKIFKFIKEHYPQFNDDEVELFISVNGNSNLFELLYDFGLTEKEIAGILGARHKKNKTGWDD